MKQQYLLDTNICIYIAKQKQLAFYQKLNNFQLAK